MSDLVDGSFSNWAQARETFRANFLRCAPRVHEYRPRWGHYLIDDARVSPEVYRLAILRKDLPAARAQWLADLEHGWA